MADLFTSPLPLAAPTIRYPQHVVLASSYDSYFEMLCCQCMGVGPFRRRELLGDASKCYAMCREHKAEVEAILKGVRK